MRHRSLGAPDNIIARGRTLRRAMTLPEVLLWQALRGRRTGIRFRRQYPVEPYVLDFACMDRRLGIEVDGEAHQRGDAPERDASRDAQLSARGWTILRIAASDVLNDLESVVRLIVVTAEALPLHHPAGAGAGEDF